MGMFDRLTVEGGVDLPHFPESLDQTDTIWQTKDFHRGLDDFKLTEDGRLFEKKIRHREKTPEEKQAEAEKWGLDSWEEYTSAYEKIGQGDGLVPDAIVPDAINEDAVEGEKPPIIAPSETTLDEMWWDDTDYHGSFEFHSIFKEEPVEYETIGDDGDTIKRPTEYRLDVFLSYEARFTKGNLDEIVLLDSRGGMNGESRDEIIEQLKAYDNE